MKVDDDLRACLGLPDPGPEGDPAPAAETPFQLRDLVLHRDGLARERHLRVPLAARLGAGQRLPDELAEQIQRDRVRQPLRRLRLDCGRRAGPERPQPAAVDGAEHLHGVPVAAVLFDHLDELAAGVVLGGLLRRLARQQAARLQQHQPPADGQELGQRLGDRVAGGGADAGRLERVDVPHELVGHLDEGELRDIQIAPLDELQEEVERPPRSPADAAATWAQLTPATASGPANPFLPGSPNPMSTEPFAPSGVEALRPS